MMLPQLTTEQAVAQMKFNDWNRRKDVVVLDTETTGLFGAEICEISVIDLDGNVLFDSLVRPKNPIPPDAQKIHGINDEMVKDAPNWLKTWKELHPILADKLVLIYNAEFDTRLLIESLEPHNDEKKWNLIDQIERDILDLEIDCVMRTYASLIGSERWVKLSVAAGYETKHRALSDCRATLDVIRSNYRPEFGEEELKLVQWKDELETTTRKIRYLNYRMQELNEEQVELMQKQKKLLQRLYDNEITKDEAAATEDIGDIEDMEWPF